VNYQPAPVPLDAKDLPRYLAQELPRLAAVVRDNAATVFYRTIAETDSLSAADSANYKVAAAANVIRISTSATITITGIADTTPYRERTFVNVGTGVLVLKSQGAESSASHRFALPQDWQISANGAATIWFDPFSARHRGLNRT
jgi:hypothetical protein